VQNFTPLALSSAEKSECPYPYTQTHTNTQTVTDISTPCLSACVDNNQLIHIALLRD